MKIKRIYLEITNACNLNCPFCTNEKGHSFMSLKDIDYCLKQIKEITDYIYLHVLGEPLLHNDIEKIFTLCDKYNLNVQLVTNGILLKNNINILKNKSLRKLSISLHSLNNISVNDEYFKMINELIEEDRTFNLELRFYNLNKLDSTLKKYFNFLSNKYNIAKTNKENSFRINKNTYIYVQELFNWPNINDEIISDNGTCHGGVDQLAILHNFDVTLCCLDPNGYNKIGNLKNQSLIEILESEKYINYISNIKNKKIIPSLCKRCSYRLRFDDKHN